MLGYDGDMVAVPKVDVTLPQSEASSQDQDFLVSVLTQVPELTRLHCTHRLSGGFSSCRIYLGTPTFRAKPAPRPWIVKIGTTVELEAEDVGLTIATAHVPPENVASKVRLVTQGDQAALLLDYASYQGRPPLDLEGALDRFEGLDAFTALIQLLPRWQADPRYERTSLSQLFKAWVANKIDRLPESIRESISAPVIYSPDFFEAYSNPAFYATRDLRRHEVALPFSFTHGDLNLRNVLYSRSVDGAINPSSPVLIDFRYAGEDQTCFVDLAKLEACLRYAIRRQIDTADALSQQIAFLSATRATLLPSTLPDACTDSSLHQAWRCIRQLREQVQALTANHPDAQVGYWTALAAYAFSAATYNQLPSEQRQLAYLDGAALFTRSLCERDPVGQQYPLPAHTAFSPRLVARSVPSANASQVSLLLSNISKGRGILVAGPGYGRTSGVEPLHAFLARLYHDLAHEDPPIASPTILLEAIQRKRPRQDIQRLIRERTAKWGDDPDKLFTELPWTMVLNWHFHDLPLRALANSGGPEPLRIDTLADAVENTDAIARGTTVYHSLFGDAQSRPDALALTSIDRRNRDKCMSTIARALEQRQAPLSIVFWRCDDLSPEEVIRLRDDIRSQIAVTVDAFYLSEVDNDTRDSVLQTLDIARLNMRMPDLAERYRSTASAATDAVHTFHILRTKSGEVRLPDARQRTRGLLTFVSDGLAAIGTDADSPSGVEFLLGGPASVADIADGRVVKRFYLDSRILPAIRAAADEKDREPKAIALTGRAGSGISTLLFHSAFAIAKEQNFAVLLANTKLSRGKQEWKEAGELVAEIFRATGRPVIIVGEASDALLDRYTTLVTVAAEAGARVVLTIGGRKDTLLSKTEGEPRKLFFEQITIDDTLSSPEWEALARILLRSGFSSGIDAVTLSGKMKKVGRLLPAIFEATDRKNRKFREIVAYEYQRYARDSIVQMAYRLVCALGSFDQPLTQFWLIKALGNRGMAEIGRVVGALSDDIITERDKTTELGDILVSPAHRIIAEEVVNIATPDLADRLRDIELLVSTANLASQAQGMTVASLLYSRGPLARLVDEQSGSEHESAERLTKLVECALENGPLHPQVEIHIRQHFALSLRRWGQFERALTEIERARVIEPDNSATLHIAGLVHESRAIDAWYKYVQRWDESALLKARGEEQDAMEFFREVREARPTQEHGYESEARYYKRKRQVVLDCSNPSPALADETKFQVYQGLVLIRNAETRVPRAQLKETPKTKAFLTGLVGDLVGALNQLKDQLRTATDPVKKVRLARAAATVANEAQDWACAMAMYDQLLKWGERDAGLYLARDEVIHAAGRTERERALAFRDSAEEFNRFDVETQVRWAELSLYEGFVRRAVDALRRADEVAKQSLNIFERENVRGTVLALGRPKTYTGKVARLIHQGEGFLTLDAGTDDVFFRVGPAERGKLKAGDRVSLSLAWRIRGLRAIDVRLAGGKSPASQS